MNLLPIWGRPSDPRYEVSRLLLRSFALFEALLLGFGATLVTLSIVWMANDPLYGVVFTGKDLTLIFVVGMLFIMTSVLSIPVLIYNSSLPPSKEFSSSSLTFLNAGLFVDMTVVVVAGVVIWWRTLQERATFFVYWQQRDQNFRDAIQEKASPPSHCFLLYYSNAGLNSSIAAGISHLAVDSLPHSLCALTLSQHMPIKF